MADKENRIKVLSEKLVEDRSDFPGLTFDEAIEFLTLQGMAKEKATSLLKISRGLWEDDVIYE